MLKELSTNLATLMVVEYREDEAGWYYSPLILHSHTPSLQTSQHFLHRSPERGSRCPHRCPNLKRTLVAMSERTGMSVSQVTDEVLYTGLIEMQELPELDE